MSSANAKSSTFDTNGSNTALVAESVQCDNILCYFFALTKYKQLNGLVITILNPDNSNSNASTVSVRRV